jgi:hypothetical protein
MTRHTISFGALALAIVAAGCSPSAECTPGTFNCSCDAEDGCSAGLECRANRCVAAPGTDAQVPEGDAGPAGDSGPTVPRDWGAPDAATVETCSPDGGMASMPMDCTAGVPVPGCPCDSVGATDTCANGQMITCEANGEFGGRWGACTGSCFSSGTWELDNTSPCLLSDGSGTVTDAFSSWLEGGSLSCGGPYTAGEPVPVPTEDWSANRLTVDCQGQFTLCYTIKAGDADAPDPSDCVVGQSCTSAYYADPNVQQELPPLGPWLASDTACARQFADSGGYGEMTVVGVTLDCQQIGATDSPYVFNRRPYCPLCCADDSCTDGFDCDACSTGGSGGF